MSVVMAVSSGALVASVTLAPSTSTAAVPSLAVSIASARSMGVAFDHVLFSFQQYAAE